RPGTLGQPLPGVSIAVRDPATGAPLPAGQWGRLWVRGPNVMLGYLADDAATQRALVDGWFDTGDTARLDDLGFLQLA
ncbi:AMP-binding protein, partial [bacterium]|nr:AMP-binding protein [bacterium]